MGRRLLIDYSKNTAPLKSASANGDKVVGMSLRYHEPEILSWLGRHEREPSTLKRPKTRTFPSAVFPVQQSSLLDLSATSSLQGSSPTNDDSHGSGSIRRKQDSSPPRSPPRLLHQRSTRSLSPKAPRRDNIFNNQVTFQMPKTLRGGGGGGGSRYNDRLHYSDSDLMLDTRSVHTTNTAAINHKGRSVFDDASINSAPAKPTDPQKSYRALMMLDNSNSASTIRSSVRSSIRGSIREEPELEHVPEFGGEDEEEEEEEGRSFLPTALSASPRGGGRSPTRSSKKKKGKKKKQQISLDDWFGKSKSPKRKSDSKSTRSKKKQPQQHEDDELSQMSQSYPMGPRARRMLPKRTMSFDDSTRKFERRGKRDSEDDARSMVSAATGNTRRGGRRPNRTKTDADNRKSPRRGTLTRTRSCDGSTTSFISMKGDCSFSFLSGSRIRVRQTGARASSDRDLLSEKRVQKARDDASGCSSQFSRSNTTPVQNNNHRRRALKRANSCDSITKRLTKAIE
ncbi:expressed unknown protein [Seminavis robusta]|uniref:Uncharacterized protein n=1 Tax=Seminavis robusta TaxID=568900 RepID=A0A9N8HPH2_9STRA|nr:expressed unknown protein [Seminavis robusta]|eukprot:Sro1328_g263230.1 n/a (511) ;mRNA; r:24191-25723